MANIFYNINIVGFFNHILYAGGNAILIEIQLQHWDFQFSLG